MLGSSNLSIHCFPTTPPAACRPPSRPLQSSKRSTYRKPRKDLGRYPEIDITALRSSPECLLCKDFSGIWMIEVRETPKPCERGGSIGRDSTRRGRHWASRTLGSIGRTTTPCRAKPSSPKPIGDCWGL